MKSVVRTIARTGRPIYARIDPGIYVAITNYTCDKLIDIVTSWLFSPSHCSIFEVYSMVTFRTTRNARRIRPIKAMLFTCICRPSLQTSNQRRTTTKSIKTSDT